MNSQDSGMFISDVMIFCMNIFSTYSHTLVALRKLGRESTELEVDSFKVLLTQFLIPSMWALMHSGPSSATNTKNYKWKSNQSIF